MTTSSKKYIWIVATVVVIVGGVFLLSGRGNNPTGDSALNLYPEKTISHGHGLAVDVQDPSKVYIATHYGLLLLENEENLYRIGKSRDDYMGFSPHPTDANIFFSSGHPSTGGAILASRSLKTAV